MLFGGSTPKDRRRWASNYASGLTPEVMGALFDSADRGELGPLNELCSEIWGKDPWIAGLISNRLSSAAECDLSIHPSPDDPDVVRASEVCVFLENVLPKLKLYEWHEHPDCLFAREKGEFTEVLEAFSIPWYYGRGYYFNIWNTRPGEPRPVIAGIEFIDPVRYRSQPGGAVGGEREGDYIETERAWLGEPLYQYDSRLWFGLDAARPGQRASLAGIGRALVFWWWLRINGAFDLSRYLEKFAVPNVIGEASYPEGPVTGAFTRDERSELEEFLNSYKNDVAALFPKGFAAKILTAPQGGHYVFESVEKMTRSALMYAILGNETTTSASAVGASTGVAGGAASSGERVEARLTASDRKREVRGLRHVGRRLVDVWYGPHVPDPVIKLLPPGAIETEKQKTNPAPVFNQQLANTI